MLNEDLIEQLVDQILNYRKYIEFCSAINDLGSFVGRHTDGHSTFDNDLTFAGKVSFLSWMM